MVYNLTLSGNISTAGLTLKGNISYTVPSTPAQEKSVTPTKAEQVVLPDLGYTLSKVNVAAIPDQYIDPEGTVEVTQNGTVNVRQYQQANVAVPNTYTQADEGKVVQSGALVAQTDITVTENGVVNTTTVKQVTVNTPVPRVSVPESDVNFYDYDGLCLYAYTAAQFAQLTAMPANPDHTAIGLTAKGWNWSFADAKTYVAKYGALDIGQEFRPTDGKTHIKIHLTEPRIKPTLSAGVNGTGNIDWGDGYTETFTGTNALTRQTFVAPYTSGGDYDITVWADEGGEIGLNGSLITNSGGMATSLDFSYGATVRSVFVGDDVKTFGLNACAYCTNLMFVVLNAITTLGNNAFTNFCNLRFLCVPHTVTSLGSSLFNSSAPINRISLPKGITTIPNACFLGAYALSRVIMPSSVQTIIGNAFRYFRGVFIAIPENVTSIAANAVGDCQALGAVKFYPTTPPTLGAATAFGLSTDCKILVPSASLNAYKTAQNYPDPTVYTYEGY